MSPTQSECSSGSTPLEHERRQRRSDNPITALHYQLAAIRHDGHLDALVLVDDEGCLVAGAGAWPVCEELAVYAPLLADPTLSNDVTSGTRIADLRRDILVRPLALGEAEVLVASRGGGADRNAHIDRAMAGCQRILEVA